MNRFPKLVTVLMLAFPILGTADVAIELTEQTGVTEQLAAKELQSYLSRIYPSERVYITTDPAPKKDAYSIRLGTLAAGPESYTVSHTVVDGKSIGMIKGADAAGLMYGVYGLLEELGCGFYLSEEILPPAKASFDLTAWDLADHPMIGTRMVFNWHNFLSGCTGWNEDDWSQWVANSQKMGFNTIMVHAYGNNPMFTYSVNGIPKETGYYGSSQKGRDWGRQHFNDVRRLPGGEIFDGPVFGADVALVEDKARIDAAQTLMKRVFEQADQRGMQISLGIDLDTHSVLQQDMILSLPKSDRYFNGKIWLPNPGTTGGYAFYKAQVDALLALYPQINTLALWRRRAGAELGRIHSSDQLPHAWQTEYAAYLQDHPDAVDLDQGLTGFVFSKVVAALRRALNDAGRSDIQMSVGSWDYDWMPAMLEYLPEDVIFTPLDYAYIRYTGANTVFNNPALFDLANQASGRIIPIIWAQHDDGEYLGRPAHAFENFHDKLTTLQANGYGIIHWMNRPLDLYFKNHENQVWARSLNESVTTTCDQAAIDWFGAAQGAALSAYMQSWWQDAPAFGRVTSGHFMLPQEFIPEPEQAIVRCNERLALLNAVDQSGMTEMQQQRIAYFQTLEEFIISFCQAEELVLEPARKALDRGDYAQARSLLQQADPADPIRLFSKLSQLAGGNRGEEAIVFSMGTRWLPHYLAAQQAAGLAPLRINYGPTSAEPLAQAAGHYTFHMDYEGEMWVQRGQQETGCEVIPNSAAIKSEIEQTGIRVNRELALPVTPLAGAQMLAPGKYSLMLHAGTSPEEERCEFLIQGLFPKEMTESISVEPTHARFLRICCNGSSENNWNSIEEININALDRSALNLVSASSATEDYPPSSAIDGDEKTRWAAEGKQWIQIPLNKSVEFSEVGIDWYKGDSRTYDFDLQVSNDGKMWTELSPKMTQQTDVAEHIVLDDSKPMYPIGKTITLTSASKLNLRIKPQNGSVVVYGITLTPIDIDTTRK